MARRRARRVGRRHRDRRCADRVGDGWCELVSRRRRAARRRDDPRFRERALRTCSTAALRARTHGGKGSFWAWRDADVRARRAARPRHAARPRPCDLWGDGARGHHDGRGVPLRASRHGRPSVRRPERDEPCRHCGSSRRRPAHRAHRCVLPRGRDRPRARGCAAAVRRRERGGVGRSRRRCSTPRRMCRSRRDPQRPCGVADGHEGGRSVGGRAFRAVARARERAACGELRHASTHTAPRPRSCSTTRERSGPASPPSTQSTSTTPTSRCSAARRCASARRPSAISPTESRRAAGCVMRARSSRSAPTRTRSSTSSRKLAASSSTLASRRGSAASIPRPSFSARPRAVRHSCRAPRRTS